MDEIILGDYKEGEEKEISEMIRAVFGEFVAPCYSVEGISEFNSGILPERLAERVRTGDEFIVTAKDGQKIVGIIGIKENKHISLLYVEKKYHCRGIARKMLFSALEKCRKKDPKLAEITVNSSLYGVYICQQLGFQLTSAEQEEKGMKFFPMSKKI